MIGLLLMAQLALVAHGPDTASTCAPIDVTVAARAPGGTPPKITAAGLSSTLQLLRNTLSSRVERDGTGQLTSLTEGTFTFAADAPARVSLPVFTATVGGAHASTSAEAVNVHPSASLPPTVIVRAWLDRGAGRGPVDSLYVGQQMDYVVDVHLNESARQRLRRNPTFFPPEMPGVLAYDLAATSSVTRTGRKCFETLSYRRALFPLFAGPSVIAPAALTYSLPLSTSFFSREESFELRTDSVRFVAADAPAAGRPANFAGAVGALSVSSRLSTPQARMGDPVVLTLRVQGTGNVKLWPRPALTVPWGTLADGPERVEVDTSEARVRGAKEFDWLLTPRQAGDQEVPRISYPYFDAEQGQYGVAETAPLKIELATASLASTDSAPTARLSIRRTLRSEQQPPYSSQPWYWLLLAAAPIPAAVRRGRERKSARRDTRTQMQQLRGLASSPEAISPRTLRRTFLGAIAERVPSASASGRSSDFARALRRGGVSVTVSDEAAAFLDELDASAFSSSGSLGADAVNRANAIAREIDAQAVRGSSDTLTRVLVVVAAAGLMGTTALALPRTLGTTFTEGVQAYDHGAFTSSQRLFARVASRAPRAVDAWANAGTAAWSGGDSAGAVRAWQRALRLDPLDSDVRDRLERIQPLVIRTPGYVPPLPVNALAAAALLLWVAAWLSLAVPRAYRPARTRAYAGAAMTVGVVLVLAALELRDQLDVRELGVIRQSRVLLDAPGSTVAAASAAAGETGTLGAREGTWVRIALDNARAGWVPIASVLRMDASPADD